jgi:hypothetical protein
MDAETSPDDLTSLRALATSSAQLFARIIQAEEEDSGQGHGFWASRQVVEFNLWCDRVGVHAEGVRSIDVRLKDVPEICAMLLLLFRSLHRCLRSLLDLQLEIGESIEDAADDFDNDGARSDSSSLSFEVLSSSEESEKLSTNPTRGTQHRKAIDNLRQHVGDYVDRLSAHAHRIHRAGAEHRRHRIEKFLLKPGTQELYQSYIDVARSRANEVFEPASDTIKARVAESLARRRLRFEYLRLHQRKRAIGTLPPKDATQTIATIRESDTDLQVVKNAAGSTSLPTDPAALPLDQKTLLSMTVDTRLQELPFQQERHEPAESVRSLAQRHTNFPEPPRIVQGRFRCPYCWLEFGESEAEKRRWRSVRPVNYHLRI